MKNYLNVNNTVLTERERLILQTVIQSFLLTASPVGSRTISRLGYMGLSPATIRNVMADLEEKGCLTHPHKSAGRVPTDLGYRLYVNSMMEMEDLPERERALLDEQMSALDPDVSDLLRTTTHVLGDLTHQLAVALKPKIIHGHLERIELMPLGQDNVLVVLAVKSGLVRTITLEIGSRLPADDLKRIARLLTQRLGGLTLGEIQQSVQERLAGARELPVHMARIFVESADRLFSEDASESTVLVNGASHMMDQPEFLDSTSFRSIIELVEDKQMIVHIVNQHLQSGSPITIGEEMSSGQLANCAIVTANYSVGDLHGTVGVIGPKRMDYGRMLAIVNYSAKLINERLKRQE